MSTENGIPVMNKPVNAMDAGANAGNLAAAALKRHPMEEQQQRNAMQRVSFVETNEEEEIRRLYGSGFAMKLATERRLAQNMMAGSISVGGGTVLSNASTSNLMTDILTGRDQRIGFEDTLGLPEFRPTFNRAQEDPHLAMEQTLRL
mmetsp:Transcript_38865/g.94099  ORF Transcript_38865/g.94099 Transcript_38865/m.94099 type:complete len:147 (+) Transcript_38865:146-586(+)|eukprot:CAMPEP_0113452350 /NCGR_PEP_ID=MMETSP0014_2-20120614/6801_1 /TAXON_ID=2857 /ORGANISM="Nitzschia sp." /LENGTH=146 /DNA_ID=CAMNT_0000343719 /DNA_START=90 /DNA_END=530 /DNA_ORIENTATION=+ /assembly_acc=CAM_ASM_000159